MPYYGAPSGIWFVDVLSNLGRFIPIEDQRTVTTTRVDYTYYAKGVKVNGVTVYNTTSQTMVPDYVLLQNPVRSHFTNISEGGIAPNDSLNVNTSSSGLFSNYLVTMGMTSSRQWVGAINSYWPVDTSFAIPGLHTGHALPPGCWVLTR